jgi:predicted transposase/invertase (TIGR01784 family)
LIEQSQKYKAVKEVSKELGYSIKFLCEIIELNRSSYYKWMNKSKTARDIDNEELLDSIKDIYTAPKEKIFENIHRSLVALNKIENQQEGIECFETYIRYIVSVSKTLDKEDIGKVIEEVTENYVEGSEVIMTIAEIWEAQGIEKGRQEGRQEEKLEVARNLIKINLSIEQIAEVTGLEIKSIEKLREQIERQENQETS